jgi:hypothetical protein
VCGSRFIHKNTLKNWGQSSWPDQQCSFSKKFPLYTICAKAKENSPFKTDCLTRVTLAGIMAAVYKRAGFMI